MLTDPKEISEKYRYWQKRILLSSIIGYATFYFVRKNLSIAMPFMEAEGIHKANLGLFLTLHGSLYGVSKFSNGFLADRSNSRAFLAVGLVASAAMNVLFGFNSAVVTLGMIWMLNGWFQGMGFPPCARLLTNWFPPKELATKFSIWNSSHCIGGGLILILCAHLVTRYGWRSCFFVPAGIALACAAFVWLTTPDTPPSGRIAGSGGNARYGATSAVARGIQGLRGGARVSQQVHLAGLGGQFLRVHRPFCRAGLGGRPC